ncbi:hypothetical protein P4S72_20400 [Vibrio sp. PP-XX7]
MQEKCTWLALMKLPQAASEQASGAERVSQGVNQIDEVTHQNSNNSESCAGAANEFYPTESQELGIICSARFTLKKLARLNRLGQKPPDYSGGALFRPFSDG